MNVKWAIMTIYDFLSAREGGQGVERERGGVSF